jgi:hypothetical protein
VRRAVVLAACALLLAGCYPTERDQRIRDERNHLEHMACIEREMSWVDGDCRAP